MEDHGIHIAFGHKGVNTDRAWPNDMVRAFVCLSLGTIVYLLAAQIKKLPDNRVSKGLFSVLEIMSVIVAMYISIFNKPFLNLMELLFVIICVYLQRVRSCLLLKAHEQSCKPLRAS